MQASRVLYQAPQTQFIRDVERNIVSQKMRKTAEEAGIRSAENEIASWENNAPHVARLLTQCGAKESYVTFEFLVPFSRKRIDCMIYGTGDNDTENVVHIELKQWSNKTVATADSDGNFTTDETADRQVDDVIFNVEAFTGHANRVVAHPSQQVKGYQGYLSNFIEVFSNQEVSLTGLAYCYNYTKNDTSKPTHLYAEKYSALLAKYPTYAKDQFDELTSKLSVLLKKGAGLSIFNKVMQSPVRPSKKLLNEVSTMIESGDISAFSLIDDQIVARNIILDKIRALMASSIDKTGKSVIIVNGGPGTGKTVIALHLLAELAKITNAGNHGLNVHYATKSKPLLEGVRSQLRPNSRLLFSNITSFVPASADENSFDVLLVDEAHRIQKNANNQYTPAEKRTNLPQIDTIIRASKITVFFIDDRQAIRGVEIGSSAMIREAAARWNAKVEECELKSQFRCNGSDNYLNWLEQVLYNKPVTSRFESEDFDLQIMDSPQQMYDALEIQNNKPGQSARIMAGFCWPWSTDVVNGDLVKDVQIGSFAMPWETSDKVNVRQLTHSYPRWYEWAYKPEGFKQVGCIYTAQGFEFDYAGVIIGPDLKYDIESQQVITDKTACKDPVLRRNVSEATMTFDDFVRNIYRVLMSRGMKGCYVFVCDDNLRTYMQKLLNDMRD
ncbi:MAG: DUF2075 domain-containing protein [Bacteroidaceae bacterium]|nr:DUF2075 domain-containing protein [Bacteroidaceae bacterium]